MYIKVCMNFLVLKRGSFDHFEGIQRVMYKRTVATTRFGSCIPAMWRRNKVTFFLFVRLLRDHPEDTGGITSQSWETLSVLIRAMCIRASAETTEFARL